MDRGFALLLVGLAFGGGIGFFLAAANGVTLDGHDHGDHAAHVAPTGAGHANHEDAFVYPQDAPIPALEIAVLPDRVSGWNVRVDVTDFTFAPDRSGAQNALGQGHAHVYLNAEKIARLYGQWMHIARMPESDFTIRVALATNDHKLIHAGGAPVEAEILVQP